MAAVEAGNVQPLEEALKGDSSSRSEREEVAAFAISTQGLSALLSRIREARALPPALADFLFAENLRSEARAGRLLETLAGTIAALRTAGVEVVALKGAVLAFFHYPDRALRPMGDLDLLLVDPRDLATATEAMTRAGFRALFDTPRHRVFARDGEKVARPASEDPGNPIRVEIHTSFRLPVLGRVYDASDSLRAAAETRDLGGLPIAIAAGPALTTHLLFHAAEDFAGNGIRGIQAHDFRLLARSSGRIAPRISEDSGNSKTSSNEEERRAAPLLFAADAVERLFPGTFEEFFLTSLANRTDPYIRAKAARLPILRYTRPARGWSATLLTLIEGRRAKARFLARTAFPGLGEVRANAAPGLRGPRLALVWARIFLRRLRAALG